MNPDYPDVAYHGPERRETLDVYLPAQTTSAARPAIVVIHGGGWHVGDKRSERELGMVQTMIDAGYVCISINYLLGVPGKPCWPTCYHDCRAAVRYLREHAETYHLDPDRIGAIGGSAGGCMSLLMATMEEGESTISGRVQAVVALYPPTDMIARGKEFPRLFGSLTAAEAPELYRAASPVHRLSPDFPPTLLIHGTADTIVPLDQSQLLATAMQERRLPHEFIIVEGAPHTFKLVEPGHDFRAKVVQFFNEALRPSISDAAHDPPAPAPILSRRR